LAADLLNIRIGNSFSGGLIDFLLFGVFQGQERTHWLYVIPLGLAWAAIYYFVFTFCIKKFKVAIPGMESNEEIEAATTPASQGTNALYDDSLIIIEALGGEANIDSVTACATRLRVAVKDSASVNKDQIKRLGAVAVLEIDGGIQAVFGGKADLFSQEINQILGSE
jgi:PTS system glucose-specific IIC component